MTLHPSALFCLLYLILLILLALLSRPDRSSPESLRQFALGGGRLPSWAVGLSILGTYVSSISFIGLPGKAFAGDWTPLTFALTLPMAAWVASRWYLPLYRQSGSLTAYGFLDSRFGPWARYYGALTFVAVQIARMGAILLLTALPLHLITGWSLSVIILAGGCLVAFYTWWGGMKAVVWTDVLQTVLLLGGALGLAIHLWTRPSLPSMVPQLMSSGKCSLGSILPDFTRPTFWVVLLYGTVTNLPNSAVDQNYVQRFLCTSSLRQARRSLWLGALLYIPVTFLLLSLGTGLFAWARIHPGALSPGLTPDQIFPAFLKGHLPEALTGLIITALLAAAMSSLDSSLNSAATVLVTDLIRPRRPLMSDPQALVLIRRLTLVLAVTAMGSALALTGHGNILDVWWTLSGVISGGLTGLFLLAGWSPGTGTRRALIAVLTGTASILILTLLSLQTPPRGFHVWMVPVIGTAIILLAGWVKGSGGGHMLPRVQNHR